MLIGIDVGGTYTDGVLFNNNEVVKSLKKPTDDDNLKDTLLQVLDELLEGVNPNQIRRVVFSTTLVTNLLATGGGDRTALILITGQGLPHDAYNICPDTYFLKGSVDFRGRVVESLDKAEVIKVLEDINKKGINRLAIVAKFSNRNDSLEKEVRQLAIKQIAQLEVAIGCETAGKLNFPRRAVTTYYTAMTISKWNRFVDDMQNALRERALDAEIDILKADGGTMPLESSRYRPCETVFSGPAASTMGAAALTMDNLNSVVIDIGGTTTDISLIIAGDPLYASKGANINGKYTHINSFAVRSVALGGDSAIALNNGELQLGPHRQGEAACFGGDQATVTDAFNYQYNLGIGAFDLSKAKLEEKASHSGIESTELASRVVASFIEQVEQNIREMFSEWENEPAYRVWEVINKRKFRLDQIIGIGAAANAIIPVLAEKMGVAYYLHKYSPVANALGACVVRPTLAFNLHVDTQTKSFFIDLDGISGQIKNSGNFQLQDAKDLALHYLHRLAREKDMEQYATDARFYREEQFNVIRGWDRVGKIFELSIQISPGFIDSYKGVKI
ncbi:MAG: hydantoinase/oxoprolinase family protein [Syntrophomonadaceae bacterium]